MAQELRSFIPVYSCLFFFLYSVILSLSLFSFLCFVISSFSYENGDRCCFQVLMRALLCHYSVLCVEPSCTPIKLAWTDCAWLKQKICRRKMGKFSSHSSQYKSQSELRIPKCVIVVGRCNPEYTSVRGMILWSFLRAGVSLSSDNDTPVLLWRSPSRLSSFGPTSLYSSGKGQI